MSALAVLTVLRPVQQAKDIDGNDVPFSQFAGKVVLITNVASACGFTEQNYKGLETLYAKYGRFGLEILAFPSNQFASQEPGDEAQIKQFAQSRFNVTFRMMSKVDVNGENAHPVFKCAAAGAFVCHVLFAVACKVSRCTFFSVCGKVCCKY